jgi:outer membrane protein OmpA-like peptidoglycan-associated protein
MKYSFLILLSIILLNPLFSQETINLTNPSFESQPGHSRLPPGWYDCGFPKESPPDTQPGGFGVTNKAQQGYTFLGMVVRDNETWEKISQRLSQTLEGGSCYNFNLYLAHASSYESLSRITNQPDDYAKPTKIRIWGGDTYCGRKEMLAESPLISHTEWRKYDFKFSPKQSHTFLTIEVYYKTPTLVPYNGNILIDNMSAIEPCQVLIASATPKPQTTPKPATIKTSTQPNTATSSSTASDTTSPTTSTTTTTNTPLLSIKKTDLVVGNVFKIPNISFPVDSSTLTASSYEVLDELIILLQKYPNVVIEVGGHTNTLPKDDYCDELSTKRAKEVANYLVRKGIAANRVSYKGYGKRKPLTLGTSMESQKINQRVEIKILSAG